MIRKMKQYEQAVQFRKRGFTYTEIAKIVGVSKSTVSSWLAEQPFSKKAKRDNLERAYRENVKRISLVNKTRTAERKTRYAEAVRSAETEFKHYKKDPLFAAGLMLYVGMGDGNDKRLIRMTGTRMEAHRIFIHFLVEYLGVAKEQIHFWILLYPDLNEEKCMKKWARMLSLPYSQFYKNQYIQGGNRKPTLHHGVGNTIIGSTVLKCKLNRWIELMIKEL